MSLLETSGFHTFAHGFLAGSCFATLVALLFFRILSGIRARRHQRRADAALQEATREVVEIRGGIFDGLKTSVLTCSTTLTLEFGGHAFFYRRQGRHFEPIDTP